MFRNHRNGHADRASFLAYVSEHSDAVHNVHLVDQRTGSELTLYRSKSGHMLGEAAYPAGGKATYRIRTAHAMALALAASFTLIASAQALHATPEPARIDTHGLRRGLKVIADPFPVAAVAEERENHANSITRPGHPTRCIAYVSTRDDGAVFVTLATTDGQPLTFPHGPYPNETTGMIDTIGAFGRDC